MNRHVKTPAEVMPAHPLAAMFPMLPDDELNALADSIKEHGQRHPILIAEIENDDGEKIEVIVDGRNRYEACRRAEVEPKFERLADVDIGALILAENVERRNLSPGQRAMARAILTKEVKKGERTDQTFANLQRLDSSEASQVSRARFVARLDEALAQSVLNGAMPLSAAYETAKAGADAKDKAARDEQERRQKLDLLRREKPKLARSVEDGDLSLDAAYAAYVEEKRQERARKERATNYLNRAMETLQADSTFTPELWAREIYRDLDAEFFKETPNCRMDEQSIRRASDMLASLADLFGKEPRQ